MGPIREPPFQAGPPFLQTHRSIGGRRVLNLVAAGCFFWQCRPRESEFQLHPAQPSLNLEHVLTRKRRKRAQVNQDRQAPVAEEARASRSCWWYCRGSIELGAVTTTLLAAPSHNSIRSSHLLQKRTLRADRGQPGNQRQATRGALDKQGDLPLTGRDRTRLGRAGVLFFMRQLVKASAHSRPVNEYCALD